MAYVILHDQVTDASHPAHRNPSQCWFDYGPASRTMCHHKLIHCFVFAENTVNNTDIFFKTDQFIL